MSVLGVRDMAFGYGRSNVWEHVELALEAGEVALDLALALCGSVSAADSARGRIRLSCETVTALVAAACALLAALLPAAWYPTALWTVAALAAAAVFRSAR